MMTDLAAGDGAASVRDLFEQHRDKVYSIALSYLDGHEAQAKDVTQQVFLKLITHIDQFRGDARFTTWLYRIVINACKDERRKRRRFIFFSEKPEMVELADSRSHERDAARAEVSAVVRRAIDRLHPSIRLTMLLKYFEDLSYEEIAAVTGTTKGTVASRLNRGHKTLARNLAHLRSALEPGA